MKIKANDILMNYEINGHGENFVLIHGAGDNLTMWYHQVPFFSKYYRVISYDIRGSGKTESTKGEYAISLFTEDVYELMKAIKIERACFLGYSMGGRIALELALKHPDMVRALVLANSSIGLSAPSPENIERLRVTTEVLEEGDIKRFAEMMTLAAFSPGFKSNNPAEFTKYMKSKLRSKPDGMARLMRSLNMPASPPDLAKVRCPVLLIVGENDFYMDIEQGKQAQEAIVGSRLLVLPTGHAAAIELPEKFNSAVLQFLSEISQG